MQVKGWSVPFFILKNNVAMIKMEIAAIFSSDIFRKILVEDGFSSDCVELAKIDNLPDGQELILLDDATIGYYDDSNCFNVLFSSGYFSFSV